MQTALPYLRIALPALLTVCIFIGTFGSQYIFTVSGGGITESARFYLYKQTAMGDTQYFADLGPNAFGGCTDRYHIINAALAMGVIGCASMLVGLSAAIMMFSAPSNANLRIISRIAQWLAAISIAVCLALAIAFYVGSFCGELGSLSQNLNLDYGFIFLIISLVLVTVWRIFEGVCIRPGSGWGVDENTPLHG